MKPVNFKKYFKNTLILSLVFITAPFFYLTLFFKKISPGNRGRKRILLIDNAKIGDLVCATPTFRAIKEKYPDSYLAALAIPRVEGILKNNRRIDRLIISNLNDKKDLKRIWNLIKIIKKENFDICINLVPGTLNFIMPLVAAIPKRISTSSREYGLFYNILAIFCTDRLVFKKNALSVRHYLDLLKFIDIENNNLKKEVFSDSKSEEKAATFLKEQGINSDDILVGMSLTAGNKIKEWGAANFASLADKISEKYGFKIIMIGSVADKGIIETAKKISKKEHVVGAGFFSLEEIPALFKRFNYFISVDTGPLYIANALDIPVIDILGPFGTKDQAPVYEKCEIVFNQNLYCWPCSTVINTATFCKEGHLKCLKETSPEMVLSAFDKLIEKYQD